MHSRLILTIKFIEKNQYKNARHSQQQQQQQRNCLTVTTEAHGTNPKSNDAYHDKQYKWLEFASLRCFCRFRCRRYNDNAFNRVVYDIVSAWPLFFTTYSILWIVTIIIRIIEKMMIFFSVAFSDTPVCKDLILYKMRHIEINSRTKWQTCVSPAVCMKWRQKRCSSTSIKHLEINS